MQYSPKLKMAMEEIKAVFAKYDLGGIVVIHTPGFSEYLYKIDPSYSAARLYNAGIRISGKAEDYGGDKKKRDQVISDTSNLLMHISEIGGRLVANTAFVSKQLDRHIDAEHTDGEHSSHEEQNN